MARTHIIAGYFMWRRPSSSWEADMRRFPYLGDRDGDGNHLGYDQADPVHIERHLSWGQAHGMRVFAPIWRGRFDGNWDVGMGRNIDILRPIVGLSRFSIMKWCLFLGNPVPGNQPPAKLDFGLPGAPTAVYTNFVETLTTGLRVRGWLEDPSYLHLGGKPAVVLFRGKDFTGDYQGAIDAVRAFHGDDIYLIGMTGTWHREFSSLDAAATDRIRAFDAATAWSVTAGSPEDPKDLAAVADFVAPNLLSWRDGVIELTVRGTARKVDFIPSITCQYDKSKKTGNDSPTRWARDREDFRRLVRAAADSLDPIGIAGTGDRAVWVQTFNEWPEGTACEPSELAADYPTTDPDYRNHYGFEFLEILRDELQPFLVRAPREPLLIEPTDGAVLQTIRPTLRWDHVKANPPVDDYRLRIERLGTGQILFEQSVGDVDRFRLPSGILQAGQNYRWQTRAHNEKGQGWSEWSSRWTFSVG